MADYSSELTQVAQAITQVSVQTQQIANSSRLSSSLGIEIINQLRNISFRLEQLNRWEEVTKLKDEVSELKEETKEIRYVMSDPAKGILMNTNDKTGLYTPAPKDATLLFPQSKVPPYGNYTGLKLQQNAALKMGLEGDERKLEIVEDSQIGSIEEYIEQYAYVPAKLLVEEITDGCAVRSFYWDDSESNKKLTYNFSSEATIEVTVKNPGDKESVKQTLICQCYPVKFYEEKEVNLGPQQQMTFMFRVPVISSRYTKSPYYIPLGEYDIIVRTEDSYDKSKLKVVSDSSECEKPISDESQYENNQDPQGQEPVEESEIDDLDDPSEIEEEKDVLEPGIISLNHDPEQDTVEVKIDDFTIEPLEISDNNIKISENYTGEKAKVSYKPKPIKDVEEQHYIEDEKIQLLDYPEKISITVQCDKDESLIREKEGTIEENKFSMFGCNIDSVESIIIDNEYDIINEDFWEWNDYILMFPKRFNQSHIKVVYKIPSLNPENKEDVTCDSEHIYYEVDSDDPRKITFPKKLNEHQITTTYRLASVNLEDNVMICNHSYQLRHYAKPETIKVLDHETQEEINQQYYMYNEDLITIEFDEDYEQKKIDVYYEIDVIRSEDGIFEIHEIRQNVIQLNHEPIYESVRVYNQNTQRIISSHNYIVKDNKIKFNNKFNRTNINVYYDPVIKENMNECLQRIPSIEKVKRTICKK